MNVFALRPIRRSLLKVSIRKVDAVERLEVDDDAIAAMKFRFPDPPRSGKVVVKVVDVAESFGSNEVFRSVDFEILRGEKVAFVGKNGEGKYYVEQVHCGSVRF